MPTLQQAGEFFRFELRQQLRAPGLWLAALACIAAGVAFAATDLGALRVVVGRVDRNVPYAVVRNLTGLSAVGMFVVLVSVGQAALRDFSTGAAALVFATPVRSSAYLAGRFLGGYCAALLALSAGVVAMAATQVVLRGSDPTVGPVPWSAFTYGSVLFLVPNVLLVGLLVFLLAIWTRSMGATFLGLLVVMIGQDVAEALPVGTYGYHLPALLDPLGLAALNSVTHSWTVRQYATTLPRLAGDLLLNRGAWMALALACGGLASHAFALKARKADFGEKRARRARAVERIDRSVTPVLPMVRAGSGVASSRRQFLAVLGFELRQLASSLAFQVILASGVAMVAYGMIAGERVMGVRSLPGAHQIAQAVARGAVLTMTLMVVLLTGESVWRERVTRMDRTIDALPTRTRVTAAGKMAALALLLTGTLALYGGTAWAMQASQSGAAAPFGKVAAIVGHESLRCLQLAAMALLLQTVAGGRMAGYVLVGAFLAVRIALPIMGLRGDLYSFAGIRLPYLSAMDGFGHTWPRLVLVHLYWTLVAGCLVLLACLSWPRGVALAFRERWERAVRRAPERAPGHGSGRGLTALSVAVFATVICAAVLYRMSAAADKHWGRDRLEGFLARYEVEFGDWRGRPRPELVDLRADVDFDPGERKLRVRGRYSLVNTHGDAIEAMLVSYDPDLALRGLGFSQDSDSAGVFAARIAKAAGSGQPFVAGVLPGAASLAGTHVVRFEPPLAPGASIQLDFDLEFAPDGRGARPADPWLQENGAFLLCGTGTHPFFRGAQFFPTLGYDPSRELKRTRSRARQGLAPWAGLPTPESWEAERGSSESRGPRLQAFGGSDWARAELWIHTPADQRALAPGELLDRSLSGDRAHHHFRTEGEILAFFPVVCGRYETATAKHGNVELEVYFHREHEARVRHILWAMRASLDYFETHWAPYPHSVLRLAEIPGLSAFACSFPGGMMAFAESMGFTSPRGAGDPLEFPPRYSPQASRADVDPVLWVVAHEVAHQWWDCHVSPALALGASFASESLAQYGSLCVVQEVYGDDVALCMAEYNRDRYLEGRSRADREERPLVTVDEQEHLHYGKGFVAFHALAELAGREPIDRALARLVEQHGGALGSPITSLDVVRALTEELPAELEPRLRELFGEIRFLESSITSARAEEVAGGRYALSVEGLARGVEVDGDGEEIIRGFTGPLELDVLFGDGAGAARLVAPVEAGEVRFEGTFDRLPTTVVLDPRLLQIDRDLSDNHRDVVEDSP